MPVGITFHYTLFTVHSSLSPREYRGAFLVRVTGLEPAHLAAQEPKSCVSANFTTPAQTSPAAQAGL